jgi:hypothetical protein
MNAREKFEANLDFQLGGKEEGNDELNQLYDGLQQLIHGEFFIPDEIDI